MTSYLRQARQDFQSRLGDAILNGDIEEAENILAQGASVNELIDGRLPISVAISTGEVDLAIRLLQHGPDLSWPPLPSSANRPGRGNDRETPWTKFQCTVVKTLLGIGIYFCWSTAVEQLPLRFPLVRHLRNVMDIRKPLGLEILTIVTGSIVSVSEEEYVTPFHRRAANIGPHLAIYCLSRILHGRLRAVMNTLLSWSWKGIVGRAALGFALDRSMIFYRYCGRSKSTLTGPVYGGLQIAENFLQSCFKSESLLLALLDQGLFPTEHAESLAIADPRAINERLIVNVWGACAELGYSTAIRRLIGLGIPVDILVDYQSTALGRAASKGHARAVETLLEHGASVDGVSQGTRSYWASSKPLIGCLSSTAIYEDEDHQEARYRVAELLINSGASANTVHSDGEPALCIAVQHCSLNTIKLLLQQGANPTTPDNDGKTPTHYAVERSDAPELLEILGQRDNNLDTLDKNGYTPFLVAASLGETETVKHLLDAGANPLIKTANGLTALQVAAGYGSRSLLELLLQETDIDVNSHDQGSDTALMLSCCRRADRLTSVTLLLDAGAEPNIIGQHYRPGSTALHEACRYSSYYLDDSSDYTDQLKAVELLVQYGADVNAKYTDERMRDERDVTPIGLATSHAPDSVKYGMLEVLLAAGADPAGLNDRRLPALLALCAESSRIEDRPTNDPVELLLNHGADISTVDANRMTCLHHAAGHRNFRALLTCIPCLDRGNNAVDAKDLLGRTALHIACSDTYWMTMATYERWSQHQRSGNHDYANWHTSLKSRVDLQALCAAEADPYEMDSYDGTTLHAAAKAGNPRIMATLLLWTGPSLLYDFPDRCERLAFHYAANSVEVTRMLLHFYQHGTVEYDQYFEVLTPGDALDRSLMHVRSQMLEGFGEELKKRGYMDANPGATWDEDEHPKPWRRGIFNSPDRFGNTPLHYAALSGNVEVVNAYLDMPDVDVAAANLDGETAFDFALEHRQSMMAILEKTPEMRPSGSTKPGKGTNEDERSQSRKEADTFIKRLGESYLWGVYRDRIM